MTHARIACTRAAKFNRILLATGNSDWLLIIAGERGRFCPRRKMALCRVAACRGIGETGSACLGLPATIKVSCRQTGPGDEKRRLMSRYKVCVCLENMNKSGYFTEKFLEAMVAGCIPVYRASADNRDTVLQGAVWFDPGDSRWPAEQAVQAALDEDLVICQSRNLAWLSMSRDLAATHASAVFGRLSAILADEQSSASVGAAQ